MQCDDRDLVRDDLDGFPTGLDPDGILGTTTFAWSVQEPAGTASATITEMLSRPPERSAAACSTSAASLGCSTVARTLAMYPLDSSPESPSEHIISRSPTWAGMTQKSGSQ